MEAMEIIPVSRMSPEAAAIERAADILRRGGIIIYPSDTCYGLGCDARNPRAMARIAALKGRDHAKKFSVIARDLDHVRALTLATDEQLRVLEAHLPGPYTFVLLNADFAVATTNTLGVRIPDDPVIRSLSQAFGEPYTTTSANLSGMGAIYRTADLHAELLDQLPPDRRPDLILDAGDLPVVPASTVVDLTQSTPVVLRQGAGEFHYTIGGTHA